ncbi:FAD-dependent oxidoreductase [Bacillus horti]|uniref:Thioredoxin reductase n=1 Tax=Caldalkalibacillus horti TaxID=77523 RepID=A0ABT9W154_9BACI|nr:FAD-dependent oxidoreductase [Bacillus horti]MDQ0166787.1 thioredoxin reductase [Bacillus horti]
MYDVAIIGAGPAGASAAIFTAKAGKKTLVVDHDKGMTKKAWFENYYGITEISGPELVETGIKQFQRLGADLVEEEATEIKTNGDGTFTITTSENKQFDAKHVILSTGVALALAEQLGVITKPGTEPRIKTVLQVDEQGRTNIDGVWAAGTAAGVSVHAIITAGDGGKVAINVISELNGERYVDHDIYQPNS